MEKFIDESMIHIRSGKGGAGCVSFHREKYVTNGGPNGGDGGHGGSVIFLADERTKTLAEIRRKRLFTAQNGQPGMGRNRSGEKGSDCIIRLPVGTVVKDSETGEVIVDLKERGSEFTAAKGGKGGLGNQHFATSVNQAPRYAQPGLPGEEREFFLEIKMIADVGLVGLPNAGKSTLLKAVTRANPKIANYPFTTLNPNLGVVNSGSPDSFIIADIPGIIEGAARGKGLGIDFLKHIERTAVLVLVVDFFTDDPEQTEQLLLKELKEFSPELLNKPMIKVGNKMDLPEARDKAEQFKEYLPVSGATGNGTTLLINRLLELLSKMEK